MKRKISILLLTAALAMTALAGCGKQADTGAAEATEVDETEDQAETAEHIQTTLTYFGSLKANDSEDSFAIFRSDEGNIIYLFDLGGVLDYGIPTEDVGTATTDDGQEYSTVNLGGTVYGYAFTNEDATEGFIVNKEGEVIPGTELGEEGARELVNRTF